MDEIKIYSALEFKRYVQLAYYLFYKKGAVLFISFIGLMMLCFSILYFIGLFEYFDNPPYTQLFLGLFFTFIIPASVYFQAKRAFSANSRLTELIIYTFTPDKIYIDGESFKSEMTWDKLYKIQELNNWVLIYTSKTAAHIIIKDSFSESQLIQFRKIVSNLNGVKIEIRNNSSQ